MADGDWITFINDNLVLLTVVVVSLILLFIPVPDGVGGRVPALQKLGEVLARIIAIFIGIITDAGTSTAKKVILLIMFIIVTTFFFLVVPMAVIIGIQRNPVDPTWATLGVWILDTMSLGMEGIGEKILETVDGVTEFFKKLIEDF